MSSQSHVSLSLQQSKNFSLIGLCSLKTNPVGLWCSSGPLSRAHCKEALRQVYLNMYNNTRKAFVYTVHLNNIYRSWRFWSLCFRWFGQVCLQVGGGGTAMSKVADWSTHIKYTWCAVFLQFISGMMVLQPMFVDSQRIYIPVLVERDSLLWGD